MSISQGLLPWLYTVSIWEPDRAPPLVDARDSQQIVVRKHLIRRAVRAGHFFSPESQTKTELNCLYSTVLAPEPR